MLGLVLERNPCLSSFGPRCSSFGIYWPFLPGHRDSCAEWVLDSQLCSWMGANIPSL